MCSRDLLFYTNAFVWTYDPRPTEDVDRVNPFITYPYQDRALDQMLAALGNEDVLIEKSRAMGATWLSLVLIEWFCHFRPMASFMLMSRTEDFVDKRDEPDSLFWKVEFIHKHQPGWLAPRVDRTHLKILFEDTGSTLTGGASAAQAGRGGRKTGIFLDELAANENGQPILTATAQNTNTRFINSTPLGQGNAYFKHRKLMEAKGGKIIRMHWSEHPVLAEGLYFDALGRPRSPWYDAQCNRMHPMEVAQELDIDYLGSAHQYFEAEVVEQLRGETCRNPSDAGDLDYDEDTHEPRGAGWLYRSTPNPPLKFWLVPETVNFSKSRYIVAADIAAGTLRDGQGASNSAATVWDRITQVQVAEYVVNTRKPGEFAHDCMALCKLFKGFDGAGAFLIWEANGPVGGEFTDKVMEVGYRNIYYKRDESKESKKISDKPGFYSTKDSKGRLLGNFRENLKARKIIVRNTQILDECCQYIWTPQGIIHAMAANTDDPTGARENHGDRVISAALAAFTMREFPSSEAKDNKPESIVGSFAWRREQSLAKKKTSGYWFERGT